MELYAQQLIKEAFGVDLGRLTPNAIPADRRESFSQRIGNLSPSGVNRMGVARLYQSLTFSDDLGIRGKADIHTRLEPLLRNRHNSLLGHGVQPVKESDLRMLWEAVLREFDISESEIPAWPDIVLTL